MTELESLNLYMAVFHYLGLSPIRKFNTTTKSRVVTIISYTVCVILAIFATFLINFGPSRARTLDLLMADIFLFCELFKFHVLYGQCYFFGSILIRIADKFRNVHKLLESQNVPFQLAGFRKAYLRKSIFVLITFLINFLIFAIENSPPKRDSAFRAIFKMWAFTTSLSIMQIVFYVDLLICYMKQLNVTLQHFDLTMISKSDDEPDDRQQAILDKIKMFKSVYHELWTIAQDINTVFGWSIAALLLQAFVNAIYTSFWVYITILELRSPLTIVCKKILLFSL